MQYGSNLNLSIEKLSKEIISQYEFNCGNEYINNCFKNSINNIDTADFVYIDRTNDKLVAYYSLSCSSIMINSNSSLINLAPAVEISVFALAQDYQGLLMYEDDDFNLSVHILDKIIEKIVNFTDEQCGAGRIVLYSVPQAYNFYRNYGFNDFIELMKPAASKTTEDCIPMYLNLE